MPSLDVVGDLGDPKKDVAALQPFLDSLLTTLKGLPSDFVSQLAGLKITISISKDPQ